MKSVLVRIWSLNSGSLLCTWHVNRGHSGLTNICLKLIVSPFSGSNWGGAHGFSDLAAYHCQRKVCSAQLNCAQLVDIKLLGVIRLCPQTRSNLLRAWYNLCVTHQQELARILTAEQGKRSLVLYHLIYGGNLAGLRHTHSNVCKNVKSNALMALFISFRKAIGWGCWRDRLRFFIYRVVQVSLWAFFEQILKVVVIVFVFQRRGSESWRWGCSQSHEN